jgi:hypothetical protein
MSRSEDFYRFLLLIILLLHDIEFMIEILNLVPQYLHIVFSSSQVILHIHFDSFMLWFLHFNLFDFFFEILNTVLEILVFIWKHLASFSILRNDLLKNLWYYFYPSNITLAFSLSDCMKVFSHSSNFFNKSLFYSL